MRSMSWVISSGAAKRPLTSNSRMSWSSGCWLNPPSLTSSRSPSLPASGQLAKSMGSSFSSRGARRPLRRAEPEGAGDLVEDRDVALEGVLRGAAGDDVSGVAVDQVDLLQLQQAVGD